MRADVAGSGVGGQAFMVSRMMIIMKTMMLEKQGGVCTNNIEDRDELHYAYNENHHAYAYNENHYAYETPS